MADEQEIDVKLDEPAEPIATSAAEQTTETKAAEPASGDDAIAELKRQYSERVSQDEARIAEATRFANEARQQAQRASQEAEQAKGQVVSSELQGTINAIAAAQSEADAAEREHAAAMEAGEWAKAAKAQRTMAAAEARKVSLERDKEAWESHRPATTEGRVVQQQPVHADPFEAVVSRFSQRAQAWLREHREVITDPETSAKAMWVHQMAMKERLAPDSDEYFQFVERNIYGKQEQPAVSTKRTPMTAAPPSRDAASAPGGSSTKVKLSAGEVTTANDGTIVWNTGPNKGKPIGTQEMARRKALLQRDGAYDRRTA